MESIRKRIDEIDDTLIRLLDERATLAVEIGKLKQDEEKPVYYRPERESTILHEIIDKYQGVLPKKDVEHLFRQILSSCRGLQKVINVAYCDDGNKTIHEAVVKHFGPSIIESPTHGVSSVFTRVSSGESDYGVVVIEDSLSGVNVQALDSLRHASVKICGEITVSSSTDSAPHLLRLVILGNQYVAPTQQDKTSLLVQLNSEPGALANLLKSFSNNSINVTLMETRPSKDRAWRYYFFLDVEGHIEDEALQRAMSELKKYNMIVTVLGSYPRAFS